MYTYSPSLWISFTFRSPQSTGFPELYDKFSLVIYFIHSKCRRLKFDPCVGKIPWRRKWQPTPVLLPGKPQGQRSLAGHRAWGFRESDTPESACTPVYVCQSPSPNPSRPHCPLGVHTRLYCVSLFLLCK